MKIILVIIVIVVLSSCANKPFINATLKAVKTGDCTEQLTPTEMNKNINGERYEFESCLPDNFNEKDFSVTRQGDTLLFNTTESSTTKTTLYKLTLDIDAYPQYRYIKLGDQILDIGVSAN
jgi:hypothetical protein